MIALLQRVSEAEVRVDAASVAAIGPGVLALIGIERDDTRQQGAALARRLLTLRLFDDAQGRMNLDIAQVAGELLLVSQFTLAADTRRGRRPGFSTAAAPQRARELFDGFVHTVSAAHPATRTGRFGAHMRVSLVNDGPVTYHLRVPPAVPVEPPTASTAVDPAAGAARFEKPSATPSAMPSATASAYIPDDSPTNPESAP